MPVGLEQRLGKFYNSLNNKALRISAIKPPIAVVVEQSRLRKG